jgi:hypothetical protein
MTRNRIFSFLALVACLATLAQAQHQPFGTARTETEMGASIGTQNRTSESAAVSAKPSEQVVVSAGALDELKAELAEQQRQIERLSEALEGQKKLLESSLKPSADAASAHAPELPRLGEVASTAGMVPLPTAAPMSPAVLAPQAAATAAAASPLQFQLGAATFTPVGFMDFTTITRSTNPGSGIGTNFGSIPYGNTAAGSLTETRLSPQNSRVGVRVDAKVKNANVLGYLESDFLGQLGNPPNGGIAVSSNSYPLRLRLYWVDVRQGKFEFLGGQSWSMLTPNRKGISALPGDLFFSQDIDVNYQLGLVWGRIPGFRMLYHPSPTVTFGVSFENSEPYAGGGNGGGAITFPTALANQPGFLGGQVNNGASVISAPTVHPDIIAKLAFDPSAKLHIDIAGVEITNKIVNATKTPFTTFTKAGVGGSLNLNFELLKNLRILTNNFWSDGGGRYIFGQAPDFILRSNGSISPVHSGSTVTGLEYTAGKTYPTLYYGYYGAVYVQRNTALDANGTTRIGYGFSGSGNGQNRTIQEITVGTNTTFWKDAKYGALNLMFQYSYLQRNPWFVATGQPSDAHVHMGFFNLRYTLPGSAPAIK